MKSTSPLPRLSKKDWSVLNLLRVYRTLTLDLFCCLSPGCSPDALRVRLDRLRSRDWICKTQLADQQPCYALGKRAQRWFGVHEHPGFPFGSHGLLQHISIATFCALGQFQRLLSEDFREAFPDCHRPGLQAQNYCRDRNAPECITWVLTDHGSKANLFPGKVSKVLAARYPLAGFQRLIGEGHFQVIVLTATPEKAELIRKALIERAPFAVPVEVVPLPNLLQFLF